MNTRAFFACIFSALIMGAAVCAVQYLKNEEVVGVENQKLEAAKEIQKSKSEVAIQLETLKFENQKQIQILARENAPKKPTDFEILRGDGNAVPTFLVDHLSGRIWRFYRVYNEKHEITEEGWDSLNPNVFSKFDSSAISPDGQKDDWGGVPVGKASAASPSQQPASGNIYGLPFGAGLVSPPPTP